MSRETATKTTFFRRFGKKGEMNMAEKYHQVTPEILEQFKAIVPGKVYAGGEINSD